MTTIYVKLLRNTRTGREEVYRTTQPGRVPNGFVLVRELETFTIGEPLRYNEEKKPKKQTFWKRLLRQNRM